MNNQMDSIDSITLISASNTLFNWNSIIAFLFDFLTGKRLIFTYVSFYFIIRERQLIHCNLIQFTNFIES